jgi:hypothetical protein
MTMSLDVNRKYDVPPAVSDFKLLVSTLKFSFLYSDFRGFLETWYSEIKK